MSTDWFIFSERFILECCKNCAKTTVGTGLAKMAKESDDCVLSSVFLSPPNSEEFIPSGKATSRVNKDEEVIPFDLDDDIPSKSRYSKTKLDILVECSKYNLVNVVVSKILNELSEKELLR